MLGLCGIVSFFFFAWLKNEKEKLPHIGNNCTLLLTCDEARGACSFQSASWSPAPRKHDLKEVNEKAGPH